MVPEIHEAVDRFEEAQARLCEAQENVRAQQAALARDVVRVASGAANSDEKWKTIAWVYWNTDLPVKVLAQALDVAAGEISPRVGWGRTGVFCCNCGSELKCSSRTERDALIASVRKPLARAYAAGLQCKKCDKESREAYYAEAARRQREEQSAVEAEIDALRKMPYRLYLRTEHWQSVRREKLRRAGYCCQLCNQGGVLDVHHRTYENRGDEEWDDLTVLCRGCHAKFHNKLPEGE